jgi:hypothetical protein
MAERLAFSRSRGSGPVRLEWERSGRLSENISEARIRMLAEDIGCGILLARDLLVLAGNDIDLVRKASVECRGAESMKAYIIDRRFRRVEA